MEHMKLQVGCLAIVLYMSFVYICTRGKKNKKLSIYEWMIIISIIFLIFDGITAYTVNNLSVVDPIINIVCHFVFLTSLDIVIFMLYFYILEITEGIKKRKNTYIILFLPLIANIAIVTLFIGELNYIENDVSNYSMGISAYTCFAMIVIYMLLSIITVIRRWHYIEKNKRINILTYLLIMGGVTGYQLFYPQALLTSLGATIAIVGTYLNLEDPAKKKLTNYQKEMIMGFSILIESRDENTGGHIKRTTKYVEILASELRKRGYYREILTKDYINCLSLSAPMHDIGKIATPDTVLKKPGKLTNEEYDIMKAHTAKGMQIINESFHYLEDKQYIKLAKEVTYSHHEKWNGEGYPKGLKEKSIPLSARIVAIADVFDATTQNRCYRDALSIERSFKIIADGSGTFFEPLLVNVFLDIKDDIIEVLEEF